MLRKTYRPRLLLLYLVPFVLMGALVARLYYIQVVRFEHYTKLAADQQHTYISVNPSRGKILEANGRELASSTMLQSVYVFPRQIKDEFARNYATSVSQALHLDFDTVYKKITAERSSPLLKMVNESTVQSLQDVISYFRKKVDPNALSIVYEGKRFYPAGSLASHIIGYTEADDTGDNLGREGIERQYDSELRGRVEKLRVKRSASAKPLEPIDSDALAATYGNSVVLTINETIQRTAESALARTVEENRADSGIAIIMGVKTGEVLAMTSYPTYDLNSIVGTTFTQRRNRILTDAVEPGSVMKIFTYASLFEHNKLTANETVDCGGPSWNYNGRTITDAHSVGSVSARMAFAKSSNIGAVKLAVTRLTKEQHYDQLRAFGFGRKTGIDLPGESPGVLHRLDKWSGQSLPSVAFGYELQVNAVQICAGAAAIANNGVYMQPHVVKEIRNYRGETVKKIEPHALRSVCSAATSRKMLDFMEAVVVEGTGKKAALDDYEVGGKTGTARTLDEGGGYHESYIASFCGVAPLSDPEVCCYVYVHNPDKSVHYYGGDVAAPAFKAITEVALKTLKIPPSPKKILEKEKNQNLMLVKAAKGGKGGTAVAKEETRDGGGAPKEEYTPLAGTMPVLTGLTMTEVSQALEPLHIKVGSFVGTGRVVDQIPRPYETVEAGDSAVITFGTDDQLFRAIQGLNAAAGRAGGTSNTALLKLERSGHEAPLPGTSPTIVPTTATSRLARMNSQPRPTPLPDLDENAKRQPDRSVGKSLWGDYEKEKQREKQDGGGQPDPTSGGKASSGPKASKSTKDSNKSRTMAAPTTEVPMYNLGQ
ncbi:MAG: transpeptidase family protein [Candidatus Sumerlaeaceae bacterium]|nr:transpeptidase family protein [Candidatus Sumerlaeaceae bacterium]